MAALLRNSNVRLSFITDAINRLQLQNTGSSFVSRHSLQLRSITQTRTTTLKKLTGSSLTTTDDQDRFSPKPTDSTNSSSSITPQITRLPLPVQAIGAKRKLRTHISSHKGNSRWTREEDMELFQLVKKGLDTNQIFAEHFSHRSFGAVIRRVSDAYKAGKVQERQAREGVQPGEIDVGRSVAGEDGAPLLRTVYKTFAQSLKAERKDRVKSDEEVQGRATYKRAKRRKGKWAPEEDEMLEQLVERNAHLPEPAIWYKVSGGRLRVDDFPLLRDSVSCCRRWRHLHPPASHQSGRWTHEEERRLQEAIWEQLEGKYQVAVDVFPNKPATTKHALGAWRPELVQLPGQEGLPILKEGSRRLGMLNWLLIAEKVGSRSDIDSRNHFYWIYHNASRGPWTKKEMARGKEGWEKFGKDYQKITAHVGTRSSTQVTKMVCYWECKKRKDEAKPTAEAVNEAKSKSIKNHL